MISSEPTWSCFVVSENNKQKASYLNAVITNKISGTKICADINSVGLHFQNNNIADSEYKFLDSMFGFDFEFALTSNSRERSSVLIEALKGIPDAQLLLVRQHRCGESEAVSLDRLVTSAGMPQECVVSFDAQQKQSFATMDLLGEFLATTIH